MTDTIRITEAVLEGARDLRLVERSLDRSLLRHHRVFVETEVTSFSTGTDLGNYLGRSTEVPGAPDYPRTVGYSNVGTVREVGVAVARLREGQRVFSMRPHCSAFIASESELLVSVPENVSSEQASLAYLTQLGVSALRQVRYDSGEHVAVVGLGVIGLATVGIARGIGARVTAIANSPVRAEAAMGVGAHKALHSCTDAQPESADIVVLTANSWEAYRCAVEVARPGGRISVLGFPGRAQDPPAFNPLHPNWLYRKQLAIVGAGLAPQVECKPHELRFNLRRNLEFILELMANRTVDLEPIISHRLPPHRMKEAYELAAIHSKDLLATVFDWRISS